MLSDNDIERITAEIGLQEPLARWKIARAIESAATAPLLARIAEQDALIARLRLEAQIHAQEARTANATIAEIYQSVTGGTGEPGNWHGAAPVKARIAELELEVKALTQDREVLALEGNKLERELEEARKDAMNAAALICDALPAPPSCNVLERNLWDVATVAAADAIRAAIKEQTK